MQLWMLDDDLWFPEPSDALPDGLLAIGGDLRPERLLLAYRSGIFPWFNEGEPPMWWSPDPRFVLFPQKLHVSHSMKAVLKKDVFEYRFNTAFRQVIEACAGAPRADAAGTWINPAMIEAYTRLHEMGYAVSAEAWQHGMLAGGLYGVRLGKIFFGESMFSRVSNASKTAFIRLVQQLESEGVQLIDCQMHTPHLESLGAEQMPRNEFLKRLRVLTRGLENAEFSSE
jgi:leucyl/phenylalanyl-tRNA--protein transferase